METIPLWPFLTALGVIGFFVGGWMRSINKHLESVDAKMTEFIDFSSGHKEKHEALAQRVERNEKEIYTLRENFKC